jgi:hypothetical protein
LRERILGHDHVRPDGRKQLVLADHAASIPGKAGQQGEGLGPQMHGRAVMDKRAALEIEVSDPHGRPASG